MHIAQLQIRNFRGIRQADIKFPLHSVLVGPNNTGKTTIIEAFALIAGRDRMVRSLTEHDFFGSNPQPQDRIIIIATVSGFTPNDHLAHLDWFEDRRGVVKYLNPTTHELRSEKRADTDLVACQIAFAARFDHESLEVETIRYFYDDHDQHDVFADELTVTRVPASVVRDIGFFLIPANRSWDRMISFGSELFRRVLASLEGPPAQSILAERDRLRNPTNRLESDERMVAIVTDVNREIKSLFGTARDLRLMITSTDSESVLDAVMPHFTGSGGALVPAKREGSGLVSLQSLFLLLHFGQERVKRGHSFIMALEEPELHLPPSVQRRILRRLQSLSTQTVASTHSPLIAAFADPTSLLVIRNLDGTLSANPLRKLPVDQSTPNALRTIFQASRVETVAAIMNDILLIPEGRLDFEWLSRLLRLIELDRNQRGGTMFGTKIGIIPTPDSQVAVVVEALAPVHPTIFALVDGDSAGKSYSVTLRSQAHVKEIFRWPDDWEMEDVIGWVMAADDTAIMRYLQAAWPSTPATLTELIGLLKTKRSAEAPLGLKQDRVFHDVCVDALTDSKPAITRASDLLEAMFNVCEGIPTTLFQRAGQPASQDLVFQP